MFCKQCGTQNDDNAFKCVQCGEGLQDVQAVASNMPQVSSNLVFAILATLFCCLPFGIVAIVYAAQVNGKLQAGDYNGAVDSSKKAAMWSWVSFGIGLVGIILCFIVVALGVASSRHGMTPY